MRATNITSYISIDPVHGPIVMMQIDDMSGHIEFFFDHGVATQATAEKNTTNLSARMNYYAMTITSCPLAMSWDA